MIVLVVDVRGIGSFESKGHPPVAADPHCPSTPAIALQRMEVVTWKPHLTRLLSNTETRKNQSQARGVLGLDARGGPATEEAFQALVLEPGNRHAAV